MKTLLPTRKDIVTALSRRIVINAVGSKSIYYDVPAVNRTNEQTVTRDKESKFMMCTCTHKALFPKDPDKKCIHILSVLKRMDEEGAELW